MTAPAAIPVRPVRFGPAGVTLTEGVDSSLYVRPIHELGPYPIKLTEKLDYWAEKTPERVFMAQRDEHGEWRKLTYSRFRTTVRNIAQALLDRPLSPNRPIAIISGNDLEHGLLGFAAMYAGIPYAPISTAYSLVSSDFGKLRYIFDLLTPGLVFASDGIAFSKAIKAVLPHDAELVTSGDSGGLKATPFSALRQARAGEGLNRAQESIGPDTVAKILFTSGSTGTPKGVMNTQRMLCSNQEMIRSVLAFATEEPPILCDWLPWNHTFGGNHDVGFVLYNGGSLYIDEGRPTPAGMEATVRNLFDVQPTVFLNVPKGFEALLPYLRARRDFRERFFNRVKLLYYAGAGLLQPVWDELQRLAVEACGERVLIFTGLGSTETGPAAMFPRDDLRRAGEIGVPAPGVELKLIPAGDKLEARLRSPSTTPGYWRQPELTSAAFDEEGFYKLGDAFKFAEPGDVSRGFVFDGRIVEDFKLSTGTFVSAGPLRAKLLAHCAPYAQDAVIAGQERDFVSVLVFPAIDACRQLCGRDAMPSELIASAIVRDKFRELLCDLAQESSGSSNRILRALLLDEPPSIDKHEITDKGSINQSAVLRNRAELVELLYAPEPSAQVICIGKEDA